MSREPKHIAVSKRFGEIIQGWTCEKYLRHAVTTLGYETLCVHGRQGSGKSNLALQLAYWIYRDWELVLDNIVFTPNAFVEKLQNVGKGNRIPVIIFDDVGVSYPSSTFRTDISTYQDIDSTWASIRTRASVIILTIPLIDRLSKNIRDNVSIEVYIGRNKKFIVERIIRLPNVRDRMMTVLRKVLVEEGNLDIYKVPTEEVWKPYWEMRLELTQRALDKMQRGIELDDPEGFTHVLDVAEKLGVSPNTVQQLASRGVIRSQKVDGLLYIEDEWIPRLEKIYQDKKARRLVR